MADKAARACNVCKTRKKGCDKAVPVCTYCRRRGLGCRYDDEAQSSSGDQTPSGRNLSQDARSWIAGPVQEAFPLLLTALAGLQTQGAAAAMDLNGLLHAQVAQLFDHARLSLVSVGDRFVRDFHRDLPVLAPPLIQETARQAQVGNRAPPADFSVLLLAMFLVTLPPPMPNSPTMSNATGAGAASAAASASAEQPPLIDPGALYVVVRMLFAHVQGMLAASTRLVQTSLLLAVYELGCGRAQTALISLATATQMAQMMGLHKGLRDPHGSNFVPRLMALEEWNVWWGVFIFERVVLFDLGQGTLRPVTVAPDRDAALPSDLTPMGQPQAVDATRGPPLSEAHPRNLSRFARHAQAALLFDQAWYIVHHYPRSEGEESRLTALRNLAEQLQDFLAHLHEEPEWACGAISTMVRALFLVHEQIASAEATGSVPSHNHSSRHRSETVLDRVALIANESAVHHLNSGQNSLASLPVCCASLLRRVTAYSRSRHQHQPHQVNSMVSDDQEIASSRSLVELETLFSQRWRTHATPR